MRSGQPSSADPAPPARPRQRWRRLPLAAALIAIAVSWAIVLEELGVFGGGDDARDARVPRATGKLVGVNAHPLHAGVDPGTFGSTLDLIERTGSNVVRIDIGWASMEPEAQGRLEPGYVGRADAFMRQAAERGIGVIVTLLGTPCWASTAPDSARQGCVGAWWERGVTAYPPHDPDDYARAAATVARRWGDAVVAIEVWNEPNDLFFLQSTEPARAYGELLRPTYRAVKHANPRIAVVAGAMAYADGDFLRRLYRDGDIAGHYDAISFHPYTNGELPDAQQQTTDPQLLRQSFRGGTEWIRDVMVEAGDRRPRLWLTEVGASTCPPEVQSVCVSKEHQARYVSQAVVAARRLPYVRAVVVYQLMDARADPGDPLNSYGLTDVRGRPKPAFRAFQVAATGR